MRSLAFIFFAVLAGANALPAAAQLRAVTPAQNAAGTPASDQRATSGFFVAPLSNTGLNAERTGNLQYGFRVPPESGAFVGYQRGNWTLGSAIHQFDDHWAAPATAMDLGASYDLNLNPRHRLTVTGGVRLDVPVATDPGPRDALSLRAPRNTDNGAGLRLSWRYSLDRQRSISTTLGYDQQFGDIAGSDSNADRSGTSFGTSFGYRFY